MGTYQPGVSDDKVSVYNVGAQGGSEVKASAWNAGDPGSIPGLGRSPGEGNGNHSNTLAWRLPWTEELGGLQSMGLQCLYESLLT